MSIYATLWRLKFPQFGDEHTGCEWVEVIAQGVPAHIGSPTPGHGYEAGDPYADFLPPAVPVPPDDEGGALRAVVIVLADSPKEGQRYVDPLVILTGEEYEVLSFGELHQQICDALRGSRPRLLMEAWSNAGVRLMFQDGSSRTLSLDELKREE